MEHCSYFIADKGLFGCYPSQEEVNKLETLGVRYFINLTNLSETKIIPYQTTYTYINYPIEDRKNPSDWKTFSLLIIKICDIIKNLGQNEKIYIHCKGGHGRSGIVVACIFCYLYNLTPNRAIKKTSLCHSNRINMKEKWRKLGSPQCKWQKDFIYNFFSPLKFFYPEDTFGLHNLSNHNVSIPNIGTFPNAHLAFQYFRDPENKEYVSNLFKGIYKHELIKNQSKDWEEKKINYMYKVLYLKFSQHKDIRERLFQTGLRPIIKISHDLYWGDGMNFQGKNILGKLLCKLRKDLFFE